MVQHYLDSDPESDSVWDCQDDMEELFDAMDDILGESPGSGPGGPKETADEKRFRKIRDWVESVEYGDPAKPTKLTPAKTPTNPTKKFQGEMDKVMHMFAAAEIAANMGSITGDIASTAEEIRGGIQKAVGFGGTGFDRQDERWGMYGSALEELFDTFYECDCRDYAKKFANGTYKVSEPGVWVAQ